jgi:hypothetical protein
MTEPGMYMSYAAAMTDETHNTEQEQQQPSELEREERRLERLRLIVNSWPQPEHFDDEPSPQTAA